MTATLPAVMIFLNLKLPVIYESLDVLLPFEWISLSGLRFGHIIVPLMLMLNHHWFKNLISNDNLMKDRVMSRTRPFII